ncbi:MAG TPA: hypothetical protein VIM16_00765 [Mucilaginibacter sp.]|jgi:predicted HAD superfamily Cof-like phosphohydrolase
MSSIYDVASLHNKMGHNKFRNEKPGFLNDDFMKMRLDFAMEELLELGTACGFEFEGGMGQGEFFRGKGARNLCDALDAIIDKVYVDLGTADLMGFRNPVPPAVKDGLEMTIWFTAWSRVHRANMLKEPVANARESSRGFGIDLKKPIGWIKPQFRDLLI